MFVSCVQYKITHNKVESTVAYTMCRKELDDEQKLLKDEGCTSGCMDTPAMTNLKKGVGGVASSSKDDTYAESQLAVASDKNHLISTTNIILIFMICFLVGVLTYLHHMKKRNNNLYQALLAD